MQKTLLELYRKPQVFCNLPSQGKFYLKGIKLGLDNQLSVRAMTASDEIMLNNPEALLNGEAIINLIASCCPDIADPYEVPLIDLDVLLISIRHATFGETLEFTSSCPKCKEKNTLSLHVSQFMDNINFVDKIPTFNINEDIKCYVRPVNYLDHTKTELLQFELNSLLRNIDVTNLSDYPEKEEIKTKKNQLIVAQLNTIANCVFKITVPDREITDRKEINDFIVELDKVNFGKLEKIVRDLNKNTLNKKFNLTCPLTECGEKFEQEVNFDDSNFFGKGS